VNVLRRLGRLNRAELTLLTVALVLLARVRIALWLQPWARMVTIAQPTRGMSPPRFNADRLAWAIRAASRAVPHATCLTQALALHHLLRCEGHAGIVQIGVTNQGGRFAAHAWVECDGVPLLSSVSEVSRYSRFFTWPPAQPDSVQ
jgi:Transglutaminase-like superfamily